MTLSGLSIPGIKFRHAICLVLVALAAAPPGAGALTAHEVVGLSAPADGVVVGPDGNIWAAEKAAGTVLRMTPGGQVLAHYPVGPEPTSLATGPGGRVWVAVTGADKLVWFDATAPSPSAHEIALGAGCGPVGIVAGGDGRMYFSQPSSGVLCGADQIGYVKEDGTELTTISMFGVSESVGRAYDLAVYGGKLFIPDYEGDVVRRAALGTLAPEAVVQMPAGSGPQGIAADAAGEIWVTLSSIGKLARFPASQTSGPAPVLTPSGGSLSNPSGIAAGAGSMYVASAGNAKLLGVDATPTYTLTSLPFDAEPWQVAAAPNGELWVSDRADARLFRVSDDPPAIVNRRMIQIVEPGHKGPGLKLNLSIKKKQKLAEFIELKASCASRACAVTATGTLSIKRLKLRIAKARVKAGRSALLKLKFPAKARKAAAQALASGKEPTVTIKARAAGGGSLSSFEVRQVKLKS
jgi:streptogramin lyase